MGRITPPASEPLPPLVGRLFLCLHTKILDLPRPMGDDKAIKRPKEALEMVRMYNPKNVVLDVLLVLEKHKIPVSLLDTVLADIRATVMSQPITGGSIGLPPAEYEEQERRLLRELESRKKGSEQLGNVLPGD